MPFGFDIKTYMPGKIICIGMNYRSHVKEQDGRFPDRPVLFSKAKSSVIKNGEDIVYPPEVKELDYEVELAVIIGKKMKNVPEAKAADYIYGYTIINDVTARDIQKSESQWYRAKSFDSFAPIGPTVVPKKEIPDPQNLKLKSYVNYTLLSYISSSITLEEGDLVATGTPAGVGVFMKHKKLLRPGDEVICEIEKIGRLTNKIASL